VAARVWASAICFSALTLAAASAFAASAWVVTVLMAASAAALDADVTDSAAGWGGLRDGVDRLAGDRVDEGVDARLDRDRLLDGGGGDGSHLLLGGEGRLHHVLGAGDDAGLPLDDARDGGGGRGRRNLAFTDMPSALTSTRPSVIHAGAQGRGPSEAKLLRPRIIGEAAAAEGNILDGEGDVAARGTAARAGSRRQVAAGVGQISPLSAANAARAMSMLP